MPRPTRRPTDETWDLARRRFPVERLARPEDGVPSVTLLLCGEQVLGARVALPGREDQELFELLREQEAPPTALRAADPTLAQVARAALGPKVVVSVERVPAMDALVDLLAGEIMKLSEPGDPFPKKASRALLEAFYAAAKRLWAAAPWDHVASEHCLLALRTPRWPDARLSVVGQLGESFAILCFHEPDDQRAFRALAQAMVAGEAPPSAPDLDLLSLEFEDEADVDAGWKRKLRRQKLSLPAHGVYPFVRGLRRGGGPRYADLEDLREATAIAEALARFVEAHGEALSGPLEAPIVERYASTVDGIPLTVELQAPCPGQEWISAADMDPVAP